MAKRQKGKQISADELRQIFRDARILEREQEGELTTKIVQDSHPSPPRADEPFCTRSQLKAFFDRAGAEIAIAHYYLRTDGTIGASGLLDPKEVVHEDIHYFLQEP
jgi:hypothetical protein